MKLNQYLESTNLSINITARDVDLLVANALKHDFLGVCVPPFWVKRAAREINDADVQLVTVVGYPLGYQMTEAKVKETEVALNDGANEIDVVLNCSSFADGMSWAKVELAKLSKMVHEAGGLFKVILETDLWNNSQLETLLKICSDTGVDFAKTSTGYHRNPVTPEIISFFRSHLPSNVGIKASGGIKTKEQALALIEAGADRIGTSSAVKIVEELR